ncbi:hypothetical protein PLICRDRAFT_548746 [Plicaturopsis crispa FD-325 SS-3]|nr:hypothetical protein PLICRDRAFT_548746 [Plicaturopsis crispa FD-325 SS-3]
MQLFIHFTQQDTHPSGYLREDAWSSQDLMLPLLEALRDIASLSVIYNMNAALEGVLRTCGAAILLFRAAMSAHFFSAEQYGGYFLVVLATVTFISSHTPFSGEDVHPKWNRRRGTTATLTVVALALYALFIHGPQHAYLPTILNDATPPANVHPPSIAEILKHTACPRNPLPGAQPWPHQRDGSNASDTYHEFDDVLLIVFFSHARYDVNLDYYQEVYAPFFPNMLFIGPGNREDLGFEHSYDVLVDSYQADEDLSDPTFYKMAGRMAHHMLYTAMQAHPCYKGYLWAPFDTLLNVPRLQLFDQDKFWYHSPWGQFVLNPATNRSDLMTERASERLDPQAVERGAAPSKNFEYNRDFFVNGQSGRRNGWNATAGGRNMTGHAPPAAVSPDPYGNVTETWKGWGQDWWWGDPHVGLSVCMPAFNRTPLHMRTRLAAMTNGTTRLIGGSADTMYIPGKHRDDFLDVLGTFLATDCFLEIATPTALHLVAPRAEDILFVDHWWIWTPPLNATFVREKWEEGLEVDTFHTFHWGDKGDDGKWAANPDNINDVRSLLVESAERQGIDWEW